MIPVGRQVLVKPDEDACVTPGGVVIPQGIRFRDRDKRRTCVIIKLGPTVNTEPKLEEGMRVLYDHFAGLEVDHQGKVHHLITNDHILAIVEDGDIPEVQEVEDETLEKDGEPATAEGVTFRIATPEEVAKLG